MLTLPPDVYYIVCEFLATKRDFGTLFHCALVNKTVARPAIHTLYRIYNQSAIFNSELNDVELSQNSSYQDREAAQSKKLLKWALLWKSIIRSSLGQRTIYPYCLYIRSLDLRNLRDLLDDPSFTKVALNTFFEGDMSGFLKATGTPMKQKMRGAKNTYTRLEIQPILELVGESVTSYVSQAAKESETVVAMDDLSGQISSSVLPKWLSRLSKLKSMTLWDGAVLNSESAEAIFDNCHDFDDLTFYTCGDGAEKDLASFIRGLRKNSLRYFTALSANAIEKATLLSLGQHAESLKRLSLNGLRPVANKSISLLQCCTALEMLELQDADGLINLEATENDVFVDTVAWLCNCKRLSDLNFQNMVSGPALLAKLCLKNDIRLQKIQLGGYTLVNNQDFHKALSHQTSLQSLELRADPDNAFRDDIDTLISSIAQLTSLRYLNLLYTSDTFQTKDIIRLVANLNSLEELWFGGYDMTDACWPSISQLPSLRALNIHAMSSFTFGGILAFVSALQETNEGLYLSIMNQSSECALSPNEQATVKRLIAKKVGGTFDFTLFREADSESESFSD